MKKCIILIAAIVATVNLFSQSVKDGFSFTFQYSSNSERCIKNETYFDYYNYNSERLIKITSKGGATKDLRFKVISEPYRKVVNDVMKVTFLTTEGIIVLTLPYKDEVNNTLTINSEAYMLANKPINCQNLIVSPVKNLKK